MSPSTKHGQLEIACFDVESLIIADNSKADRIEFCADRGSGGVTPSINALQDLKEKHFFQKPINIMIRPRGGDFNYSDKEFQQMKVEIQMIKLIFEDERHFPAFGFVFGVLDAKSLVDITRNSELVNLAKPAPCTLHRAFDETPDLEKSLADAITCGFKTILTSGGAADAAAGVEALHTLVTSAKSKIIIMPCGGIRSSNIEVVAKKTYAKWYHSSAILDGNKPSVEEIALLEKALYTT